MNGCAEIVEHAKNVVNWDGMRQYSKTQVNKAGKTLKDDFPASVFEVMEAENVLTYWRFIHAPVINTFQATLRTKISKKYKKAGFIAQRLKRAPSIIAKLKREPHMKLSTMQDIAGIRAVMKNLSDVFSLAEDLKKSSSKHKMISETDYITNPKYSGYRSIHLVFEYVNAKAVDSNGLRIEVQLRTQLQHIWATAVETMGTFLNSSLKASEGDEDILNFFALVSSAFALREKTPPVEGFEQFSQKELLTQVIDSYESLAIKDKLTAYSIVAHHVDSTDSSKSDYQLIVLDLKKKNITVQKYSKWEIEKANVDYTNIERTISGGAPLQAVLISVDKISTLKKAYPNYFLDTKDFISKIEAIRGLLPKLKE